MHLSPFHILSFLILGVYSGLLLLLLKNIRSFRSIKSKANHPLDLSLIVPFHKEENMLNFLKSLKHLNLEGLGDLKIVLVDDRKLKTPLNFSCEHHNIELDLVENTGIPGKKQAIIQGLDQTKTKWIMTTDSDCLIGPDYFQTLSVYLDKSRDDLLAAPVLSLNSNSFEGMNLLSLSAFSCGSSKPSLIMASGANLIYKKSCFEELKPYQNNLDIPSGDDMFLLKSFAKAGKKSTYLPEPDLVIRTDETTGLKHFLKQQHRWVAKTHTLKSKKISLAAMFITLSNTWLIVLLAFESLGYSANAVEFWLLKIAMDWAFLRTYQAKVHESICLKRFLINAFIYPFFGLGLALMSFIPSKDWD